MLDLVMKESDSKTGFKDANSFCVYLEELKLKHNFESYIETVVWYVENESDLEPEDLVKYFNKKILDAIKFEAISSNRLKESTPELVGIF